MTNKFLNIFKYNTGGQIAVDCINPYAVSMDRTAFINFKTALIYAKILKRCYAKSTGLTDEQALNLWDSAELSLPKYGVINLIANAMMNKAELYLVYDNGIARVATNEEQQTIKKDYDDKAHSSVGVLVNFQKYTMTDIIKLYMGLIFDVMQAANTNINLSKALQVKILDMRKTLSVSAVDDPREQAKNICEALKEGKSVATDAGDSIVTTDLQTTPVVDSLKMIYGLLAAEIGVSTSFVCGELTSGMAVTGEADVNANEDGIKDFFNSVFKPILDKLFGVQIKFKTDNFRRLKEFAQMIPYIESSEIVTDEQKKEFLEFIFEKD